MQSESNVTWYDLCRMHMYECLFVRYFGKYFSKVDSKVIFSWTNHNLQFYSNSYRFIIIKDMNVCCIIIWFITKKKNILSYQGEKEKERNKKERHILNQTILQTWFVAIFFFFVIPISHLVQFDLLSVIFAMMPLVVFSDTIRIKELL